MWIVIACIALAIGLVAYPLLQLKPSRHQQHIMHLRQQALRAGLSVEVRAPMIDSALTINYPTLSQCVAYCLKHSSDTSDTILTIRHHTTQQWRWVDERPPPSRMTALLEAYDRLPNMIRAVEHSPQGCAVFLVESPTVSVSTIEDSLQIIATVSHQK